MPGCLESANLAVLDTAYDVLTWRAKVRARRALNMTCDAILILFCRLGCACSTSLLLGSRSERVRS